MNSPQRPPESNKDDPKMVEYYQTLADILGVFWQFHKKRLDEGNLAFAYSYAYEGDGNPTPIPFDSNLEPEDQKGHSPQFLNWTYLGFYADVDSAVDEAGLDTGALAAHMEIRLEEDEAKENIIAYYQRLYDPTVQKVYKELRTKGYTHKDLTV
ncbi:MAG: hypothetical protein AAB553_00850 [Patescibacteria group bacterium]